MNRYKIETKFKRHAKSSTHFLSCDYSREYTINWRFAPFTARSTVELNEGVSELIDTVKNGGDLTIAECFLLEWFKRESKKSDPSSSFRLQIPSKDKVDSMWVFVFYILFGFASIGIALTIVTLLVIASLRIHERDSKNRLFSQDEVTNRTKNSNGSQQF